ncbi:transglycosylase SLT domain-containing protein [Kitasatospora sp. NPDC051853]|uniref:transglycosylase SLT domain-containing protein n=1 Tax=Kitasatospora sp. NPDC051853 TaxID=3364058 RepID=UPI0037B7AC64
MSANTRNRHRRTRIRYDRLPNKVLGLGIAGAVVLSVAAPVAQAVATPAGATQLVAAPAPAAGPAEQAAPAQDQNQQAQNQQGQSQEQAQQQAPAEAQQQAAPAAPAAPTYANNLDGWIKEARDVLAAAGKPVPSYRAMYATAMAESTGNPKAVNGWDSNAAAGTPSIGLTQMIKPTFRAYALPGHTDIYNPVDNLIASSRYCDAVYGGMDHMASARGYGSKWRGY